MNARGLALITVLWVLTLLSLIAASFSNSTRTEIKLAFNQAAVAQAEALADAGVHAALLGLMASGQGGQWRVDGTVYGWRFGAGEIRVSVQDEGGKIDLNVSTDALLKALMVAAGESSNDAAVLVDRIVDYRDINDLRQLNGAEDRDYSDAELPYGAKDAPFEAVEELRQVYGMTTALFDRVAPALTVQAAQREPHVPTAPALVRAAMAGEVPDEISDEPVAGKDGPEAPETIGPDTELSADEPREPPVPGEFSAQDGEPLPPRSRTNFFTIHSEARSDSGAVFVREAVVEIGTASEPPYDFWGWKQGRRILFPIAVEAE